MAMGSVPPSPSWEPFEFVNPQRGAYDNIMKVRMSNLKPGYANDEVALVRNALVILYAHALTPGNLYDDDVIRCIKKWQKHMGEDVTGKPTRDQIVALGAQSNPKFGVV